MTTDELMALVDGLCEAVYNVQNTDALRASLREAIERATLAAAPHTATPVVQPAAKPLHEMSAEELAGLARDTLTPQTPVDALRLALDNCGFGPGDTRARLVAEFCAALPVVQPVVPAGWQPIETAPRGSGETGPSDTRDPAYVEPPKLLLWTREGPVVGYYDWYYHPGYGRGAEPGESVWRDHDGGRTYGASHWMPLPAAPASDADSMQGSQPTKEN